MHEVVGVVADVVAATAGIAAVVAMIDSVDRVVDWWARPMAPAAP